MTHKLIPGLIVFDSKWTDFFPPNLDDGGYFLWAIGGKHKPTFGYLIHRVETNPGNGLLIQTYEGKEIKSQTVIPTGEISNEEFKNLTMRDLISLGFKKIRNCPISFYPENCEVLGDKYNQLVKEFKNNESELFYEIPEVEEPPKNENKLKNVMHLDGILHKLSQYAPPLNYFRERLDGFIEKYLQEPPSKYIKKRTDIPKFGRFLREGVEVPEGCKSCAVMCYHLNPIASELVSLFDIGLKSIGGKIEYTNSGIIYVYLRREEVEVAPGGFEPPSSGPEPDILDH